MNNKITAHSIIHFPHGSTIKQQKVCTSQAFFTYKLDTFSAGGHTWTN